MQSYWDGISRCSVVWKVSLAWNELKNSSESGGSATCIICYHQTEVEAAEAANMTGKTSAPRCGVNVSIFNAYFI